MFKQWNIQLGKGLLLVGLAMVPCLFVPSVGKTWVFWHSWILTPSILRIGEDTDFRQGWWNVKLSKSAEVFCSLGGWGFWVANKYYLLNVFFCSRWFVRFDQLHPDLFGPLKKILPTWEDPVRSQPEFRNAEEEGQKNLKEVKVKWTSTWSRTISKGCRRW